MQLGYRVLRPDDVGKHPLSFVQISLWKKADWGVADGEQGVREAIEMADECRKRGMRSVFHPLEYPLTGEVSSETLSVMRRLAQAADLGIIVHDEGQPGRERLTQLESDQYQNNIREISKLCRGSIENSYNSGDITWFWDRFVLPAPDTVSLTLDIGHLELGGIDSISFVSRLSEQLLGRLEFVHLHHHAGSDSGVKDHRPLVRLPRNQSASYSPGAKARTRGHSGTRRS